MSAFVGFDLYTFDRDNTGRRSFADLAKFVKSDPTVEEIVNLGTASIGLFRKGFPFFFEDPRYKGIINIELMQHEFARKIRELAVDPIAQAPYFVGFYRGFKLTGIKVYVPNFADENCLIKHFETYGSDINYQPKSKYWKLKHYK